MHQRRQRGRQIGASSADLDPQGTLPSRWQRLAGLEHGTDAITQPQTLESCSRQNDGVVLAVIEFAQAGVQVASQGLDAHIMSAQAVQRLSQQHQTAQAGRAHHSRFGQLGQTRSMGRHPGVARVLTFHHAGQFEACWQVHGDILERVDRDVCTPLLQSHLQLLDEQPLATDLGQAAIKDLVTFGCHAQQADRVAVAFEQSLDVLGLPERQPALAGGDGDGQRLGSV